MQNNTSNNNEDGRKKAYYDLTEEASKRPGGEEATRQARIAENDDAGQGTITGTNTHYTENKVATSLDDE